MPDFTSTTRYDRSAAEPFEVGTVQWTRRPGEGDRENLASGFWFITPEETPGAMRVVGHADETVYIIEGHLRVEPDDSDAFELTAGSVATFNKGTAALWTVLAPTVEFFVYS
ncbi:cupin domain-containing protein [Microbacterium sp. EST19A]|uniref:cupin domain-containing protein n=1 Tax=Microbacterium sp. EST19A TaxID=2862681 RepID=UPI001CBB2189|nr:cupin domain-containing protein [Microbacterium sp. EST19A]